MVEQYGQFVLVSWAVRTRNHTVVRLQCLVERHDVPMVDFASSTTVVRVKISKSAHSNLSSALDRSILILFLVPFFVWSVLTPLPFLDDIPVVDSRRCHLHRRNLHP